jgi:uncharacterized membrane protein
MGSQTHRKRPRPTAPALAPPSLGLDRIVFFSDAVMAIAITLLVLDLKPAGPSGELPSDLTRWVLDLWPKVLGYAVSFWVVALYWVAHHRCFRYVERYDRRLIYLNFLFLMFAAFIPFPTALLFSSPAQTASAMLYAGTAAGMGFSLGGLWIYAVRRRLVAPGTSTAVVDDVRLNLFLPPLVFSISMGVSLVNANLAMYSWLLLIPVYVFRRRREISLMKSDLP